jgi:hypothetical protein
VSETPLYDQTLSDALLRARREGELARIRGAQAEQDALRKVAAAEQAAAARVAAAEARAAQAERAARVRRALITDEVEDQVRHALASDAPPLPELRQAEEPEPEPEPPPIPSMAELMRPHPGVNRFLDSLLGAPDL